MSAHYFLIEDLGAFLLNLEGAGYRQTRAEAWTVYSKTLSGTLVKHYAYPDGSPQDAPVQIRVNYDLIDGGNVLKRRVRELKELNYRYRQTLAGWKTKRPPTPRMRERRWTDLQRFFQKHGELIACFKYKGGERVAEGNYLFNLQVPSTPKEQGVCLEFIKTLADAQVPHGIIRRRREADKPVQQRNGWIKRYARFHRKRGWSPLEIAREIQKELRNGTWNERSRIQYNIADNTIAKIAGLKITHAHRN